MSSLFSEIVEYTNIQLIKIENIIYIYIIYINILYFKYMNNLKTIIISKIHMITK